MNLKEYLFFKEMSVKEFAKLAGFNETYMSAIMNKKRLASKKALKLIEFATEGWVKEATVFEKTKLPEGFTVSTVIPMPKPETEDDDKRKIG